jgi:serine kinase of HPr protein (carbohydrate metabolism regulator)
MSHHDLVEVHGLVYLDANSAGDIEVLEGNVEEVGAVYRLQCFEVRGDYARVSDATEIGLEVHVPMLARPFRHVRSCHAEEKT